MSIKGEDLSSSEQHPLEGENKRIHVFSLKLAEARHFVQSDLFLSSRSKLCSPPVLKGFRSSHPP